MATSRLRAAHRAHRMRGREEGLAVVAEHGRGRVHGRLDGREEQHVGMDLGVPAELLDDRLVDAVGVVLDVVAVDADGVLEVLVDDRVGVSLERLDHAAAEPLAELGGAAQPRVGRLPRARAHDRGDLLVVARRGFEPALEDDVEAGEQCGEICCADFHRCYRVGSRRGRGRLGGCPRRRVPTDARSRPRPGRWSRGSRWCRPRCAWARPSCTRPAPWRRRRSCRRSAAA